MTDRLFVPLNTMAYRWFDSGRKTVELRGYGGQYTEKHVYTGRDVELRRGYTEGDSLWGKVGKVTIGSLDSILRSVPYTSIIPTATSKKEMKRICAEIMGVKEKYIAFKVVR